MTLALVFILLAAAVGTALGVETLVMAVLGAFGTIIVQGIKKYSGANGNMALNITVGVSVGLALMGAFATKAFTGADGVTNWASILNGAFVVFGVATLAYKYLLSKDTEIVSEPPV
jgi:hypothetical protein